MYYIYILYSVNYDRYYVGYTSNYQQRLQQHNTQEYFNTYTSKYRPWRLASVFECGNSLEEVIKLERFIKRQKSRSLLEKLSILAFKPDGILAQLVRVPQLRD